MSGKPAIVVDAFRRLRAPARPVVSNSSPGALWYQCGVLGLAVAVIYTNLPIHAYTWHAALPPKYAFFVLFLLMTPLLLTRQAALVAYLLSPFALWAGALIILNLIHLSAWPADGDLVDHASQLRAGLVLTRIQYILFAVFVGFVVFVTPVRTYLAAAAALMVLLPGAVLVDFAHPGLFYPLDTEGAVLGRAAATFINPTMAGEALLHVFLLGCVVVGRRWRGPLFLLAGAAVFATFSRSSMIAWGGILAILVARGALPRSMAVTTLAALAALVLWVGSFESYLHARDGFEAASSNLVSRLEFFSNLNFDDDSSEERASVVKAGWEMFLRNPVFGAGAGATQFWAHRGGTHNQLVMFAAEYGVFGIGLWVWLLAILWRGRFMPERGLQFAMVFLVAFMSMFTHQMLDSASYWLATFALVATRAPWTVPDAVQRSARPRARGALHARAAGAPGARLNGTRP
jgi:O-antigen ligase